MKKTNLLIMSAVLTLAACNGGTQPAGESLQVRQMRRSLVAQQS